MKKINDVLPLRNYIVSYYVKNNPKYYTKFVVAQTKKQAVEFTRLNMPRRLLKQCHTFKCSKPGRTIEKDE